MDIKETFANKLRELRVIEKLSQTELAEKLGVSRGSISFYENGERTADIDFIYKAAQFFNVSADYLIGRTNASTQNEDIRAICDYTGLSEAAVSELHREKNLIDIYNSDRKSIEDYNSGDEREMMLASMVHSGEITLQMTNLFIESYMLKLAQHLKNYKFGINGAVEEHRSFIDNWKPNNCDDCQIEPWKGFFIFKFPQTESEEGTAKEQLAKYELYEAADDFKSLLKELASEEERALREIKAEYKKLEEAEKAALIGEKNSGEEAKDSDSNGNDN